MHHHPALSSVAAALLAVLPAVDAGLYPRNSPVIQIDAKNYDSLIAKSNYTSIVEFYAPWCGHCQNLKPAYEKAARNLDGLAKVAAVNCDDDQNKAFCGTMEVQGFPTLKIVRPGSKRGRPVVEDYQGPRTAKGIVDALVDKINNHVKRITDKDMDNFLSTKNESAKAILFTEKGTASALLKSIAIDFLDVIIVGQVRNTEKKAVELFGIDRFPSLVLLPGADNNGIVYDGELKKGPLVQFLSQAGSPNPDPAPKKTKTKPSSVSKEEKKEKEESKGPKEEGPTEPLSDVKAAENPIVLGGPQPIPILDSAEKLVSACLRPTSHTCVLAFVPKEKGGEVTHRALTTLAELAHKHTQSKRHLFPIYEVHTEDAHSQAVLKALGISFDVTVVAINARRGWWRLYEGEQFGHESIESWIDQIRLSEGVKRKLPEGVVAIAMEGPDTADNAAPAAASSEPTPKATDSQAVEKMAVTVAEPDVTPIAKVDPESLSEERTPTKGIEPTVQDKTAQATETPHDEL